MGALFWSNSAFIHNFILTEKKQFFQINKKNTTTLDNEHWAKSKCKRQKPLYKQLAKETQDLQTAERAIQTIFAKYCR